MHLSRNANTEPACTINLPSAHTLTQVTQLLYANTRGRQILQEKPGKRWVPLRRRRAGRCERGKKKEDALGIKGKGSPLSRRPAGGRKLGRVGGGWGLRGAQSTPHQLRSAPHQRHRPTRARSRGQLAANNATGRIIPAAVRATSPCPRPCPGLALSWALADSFRTLAFLPCYTRKKPLVYSLLRNVVISA